MGLSSYQEKTPEDVKQVGGLLVGGVAVCGGIECWVRAHRERRAESHACGLLLAEAAPAAAWPAWTFFPDYRDRGHGILPLCPHPTLQADAERGVKLAAELESVLHHIEGMARLLDEQQQQAAAAGAAGQ